MKLQASLSFSDLDNLECFTHEFVKVLAKAFAGIELL